MKTAAIIGTTSWYSGSFARALLAQADVTLVAAADLGVPDAVMQSQTQLTHQEYAARYGGLRLYPTPADLLSNERIDLAFICAPDRDKASHGVTTISAGIDTYFAKPMTTSLEGVRQIVAAAHAHPSVWVGALNPGRFDGAIRAAYQRIQQGVIGEVLSVRAWIQHGAWPSARSRVGSPENDDGQGGPAYSFGLYAADLLNWFMGSATVPHRAYAEYATLATPHFPFPDSGKGTVRYADGRLGSMDLYYATPCPAPEWEIEVAGRAGILRTTGAVYEGIVWHVGEPPVRSFYRNQNDVILAAITHWVASCRERSAPEMNLVEACRAIQLCVAWEESSALARPVEIEPVL
jgi:predicted dehydrogenase